MSSKLAGVQSSLIGRGLTLNFMALWPGVCVERAVPEEKPQRSFARRVYWQALRCMYVGSQCMDCCCL